ncbi:MAG: hypothetical protein WCD42_05990 [Rhizomicrobium sp.]
MHKCQGQDRLTTGVLREQIDIILDNPDDAYPRRKHPIIGQIWRSTPQGYLPVTNKKGGH